MQIVIDMPEEEYNIIKNSKMPMTWVEHLIANGTPLPKGHGRIKDIDKIEWYGCTTEFDCPHKAQKCKNCDRAECSKTQVDAIPTIIEADFESGGC